MASSAPGTRRARFCACRRPNRPTPMAAIRTIVPMVCPANRSVLPDRDGDESPATAVAVVCPPRTRGPRAVGGDFRRTAVAGSRHSPRPAIHDPFVVRIEVHAQDTLGAGQHVEVVDL